MALDPKITRCGGEKFAPIEGDPYRWAKCPMRDECLRWLHLGSATYQTPRAYHLCRDRYSEFLSANEASIEG
jgi:hypothetical protein